MTFGPAVVYQPLSPSSALAPWEEQNILTLMRYFPFPACPQRQCTVFGLYARFPECQLPRPGIAHAAANIPSLYVLLWPRGGPSENVYGFERGGGVTLNCKFFWS